MAMFGSKKKDLEKGVETVPVQINDFNYCTVDHIYSNDYPRIISRACAVCWDKVPPEDTEKRIEYISKRIKTGHTSILEHSNIVMLATLGLTGLNLKKITEFVTNARYLVTKVKFYTNEVYLLISGSLRGYFDVFNKMLSKTESNPIISGIINEFYKFSYKGLFQHYIDAGMIPDMFESYQFVDEALNQLREDRTDIIEKDSDKIYVENYDNESIILNNIRKITRDKVFTFESLMESTTVTVLFKGMSRTATHQLVRHRNAITQESQRYVDYSNADFISPGKYNEKIAHHVYNVKIFGKEFACTLQELGEELCGIYQDLIQDNDGHALRREEARAFLPSNVACNKLYMTFNLMTLFKFLELRTDKAAQAEIRDFAVELLDQYTVYVHSMEAAGYYAIPYDTRYLLPRYVLEQVSTYDEVDEVIEDGE